MLLLKIMLLSTALGVAALGVALAVRDLKSGNRPKWAQLGQFLACSMPFLLFGLSIGIVPPGEAGLRVSQFGGVSPNTLYPGVYFLIPFIERIERFETRDHVFTSARDALNVQSKEGLSAALAVTVRYTIDSRRLAHVQGALPRALEADLIAPLVSSVFRELGPSYPIKDLYSGKRDEFRSAAAGAITRRLAADGIVVKEVLLKDLVLPAQYAKGLESLLQWEQESQRLAVELDAKQKQVKVEALEADSKKNTSIKEAEAQAQAKLLDSRAEMERLKLLAEAEEFKVRKLSVAQAEKLRLEAEVLKQNPMVIQKIIAEKLSDKVQIMMVPSDGKYFFANDVLRSALTSGGGSTGNPQ
jgi:regulator of protease activity HflC (stomatin/prohibitin superfamily)